MKTGKAVIILLLITLPLFLASCTTGSKEDSQEKAPPVQSEKNIGDNIVSEKGVEQETGITGVQGQEPKSTQNTQIQETKKLDDEDKREEENKPGDAEKSTGGTKEEYKRYFKGALFIGDSITEGLASYELIDDSNIFAGKGFTAAKALKELYSREGVKPKTVYVLLGANDVLYDMSSDKFKESYRELIQTLKQKMPGAKIYIQSIFPVASKVEVQKPMMNNKRIDEFNRALEVLALEEEVEFLYIAPIFKDKNGFMAEEHSSDGIHLKYKSYMLWLDYIKEYAV